MCGYLLRRKLVENQRVEDERRTVKVSLGKATCPIDTLQIGFCVDSCRNLLMVNYQKYFSGFYDSGIR